MPRAPSESVLAPLEVVLELLELLEAVPLAPSEVVQAPSEVVLKCGRRWCAWWSGCSAQDLRNMRVGIGDRGAVGE